MERHGAELAHSCATAAQVKDCEGRLTSRVTAVSHNLEERLSDAATLVTKATLQQSQDKFEALRDRVLSSVSGLEAQVLLCCLATTTCAIFEH